MRRIIVTSFIIALLSLGINEVNAQVSVGVSIHVGPPALPIYTQPMCPGDGYMWTPGYWAYGPDGYYWVPGAWVLPPRPRLLWTPGYWGFAGGVYAWHAGYWGPHIGFYGGINYGFGYGGVGFEGGMWRGNVYHYNTACANINTTVVHNTYVRNVTVINNNTTINNNRTSYNGEGGVTARPNRNEELAARDERVAPTQAQISRENTAMQQRAQPLGNNSRTMANNNNHERETNVQGTHMSPATGNNANNLAAHNNNNNEPLRNGNGQQPHNEMREMRAQNNNEGRTPQQHPQQAMRMQRGGGQPHMPRGGGEARAHHERMHRG